MKPIKPMGEAEKSRRKVLRRRREILTTLFPEGINSSKIWNAFVTILRGGQPESLSVEALESVAEPKFKLKRRISRHFPGMMDQLYIIASGDMDLLRHITQRTWQFSDSHRVYADNAIVLHGPTQEEIILDWAAQSVITMLLRHIKANVQFPRP